MRPAGVAFLLAGCACAVGCAGEGEKPSPADRRREPPRHAVLLTIDTWRADRFGAGGHPGIRTPNLDRFFRGATQFSEAYSSSPTTLASHTSMLTGLWPTRHGVPRNLFRVPEDLTTLAEILGEAGFRTGAYVSSAALDQAFGLDQGFDVYNSYTPIAIDGDYAWRSAEETLTAARRWWSIGPERKFLWIHFFEPHFPYQPDAIDFALYDTGYRGPADGSMAFLNTLWRGGEQPPEDVRAHIESLYLAEITGLDRSLGAFLRVLAADEETVTIVIADHGEALGEYGAHFVHGPSVYPHDVRVPLAVRGRVPFGSGVSGAMVRTIDIPGTFLAQLGVKAALPDEAANLEDWAGRADGGLAVLAVASMPWSQEEEGEYRNARKQRLARTPTHALSVIPWTRRVDWYDRTTDPGELVPLEVPEDSEAGRMRRALDAWVAEARVLAGDDAFPPDLEEKLRALGYVR